MTAPTDSVGLADESSDAVADDAVVNLDERRVERETGIEPATSSLGIRARTKNRANQAAIVLTHGRPG